MPIRKRGNVYYIDIYTPSGERVRRTIKTTVKKEAQQYHDQLKSQLWKIDKLDQKPEYLFENALVLFLKDAEGKEDTATKKRHAIYYRNIFAGRKLSSLTSDEILDAIPENHMTKGTPLTNSTKNKYRTSIMRILKLAYQSGYIDKMPYIPKKKEPPIRVRWITKEQAKQLIDKISTDWMKTICSFALLTGARRTEILSMTWDKIDFTRKVAIVSNDIAKSEKARSLLLNDDAIKLLQKQKGKNPKYVFVGDKGQPLKDINRKTFNKATEKCFLIDFHFHDLRHTWASWHVQSGTPLFTLKELGGWETLEMVKKYAHLNADHLLSHANSVKF
ncbi:MULTISPECIES: tyrosine-type recombinase/integrase [Gallibacterium]|uniref:Integrase n=3 Tax=Gallibacterium TaxID=155493 RepID=A0A0A2Y2Y0_9PAST|nr:MULTISPECIES: site-specific integrase [Gallibacterium]KGQ30008.1 integrase [Gallibacterium genomosp. 2]KGQ36970.1 integrase [Gallibacterium genomosp. 1]KGQ66251.1 integrase [Gallibacterium anatis]MDK9429974.1 tyrosine-type recombinase/integrase [Gallibacterium anatis]OBX01746.1 integrase [Gallibacterium genomosp. 1]